MAGEAEQINKYKVRLTQASNIPLQNNRENAPNNTSSRASKYTGRVVFDVTPELTENRQVEYKSMNPVHMPGQIFVYGSTMSRTFQLSAVKLIARTTEEATRNMNILWTLRSWTMPYFGINSSTLSGDQAQFRRDLNEGRVQDAPEDPAQLRARKGQELLGKPPEVLLLSAYTSVATAAGNYKRDFQTNLSNVPVVITNLTIPYPADVDYIPDENNQPVPRVMLLDIQLQETRAPREYTQGFSLQQFRQGLLDGF